MNGSPTVTAPLLVGEGLPAFGAITAAQVEEHIPELLSLLNGELDALEAGDSLRALVIGTVVFFTAFNLLLVLFFIGSGFVYVRHI